MGAGELGQTEAIGSGGTLRPKLTKHGKFFSQSVFDGIPRRRLAKEEALAEQRHDGSDHKEGGSGPAGSALVAARSFGCALLLHQRGKHAIGANNGSTQKNIFLHVLWLGLCCVLLESLQTKPGTAAIKTSKSTSLSWQRTWIVRTSSTIPGQCGNGLVTLQAQRLGREVGFLLF